MEWKAWQVEKELAAGQVPPFVLVYGDDHGAVHNIAQQVVAASGVALGDPFLSDQIDGAELQESPGRLLEAATTMGFGGGMRLVRVQGAAAGQGKSMADAVTNAALSCLQADLVDVCVVLPVSGLDTKSKLAKEVAKHPSAVAVRCFAAQARDVATTIRNTFQQAGKRCNAEAQQFLQDNLGQDAAITQHELNKLITYLGDRDEATLDDVLAVLASAPSRNVFALCDAVGNRQTSQADKLLHLLLGEGEDPYSVANMVHRHLNRLSHAQQGLPVVPPVPPFQKQAFQAQVDRYPAKRLHKLASRYLELQLQLRGGVLPPELAVSRWVLGMAA